MTIFEIIERGYIVFGDEEFGVLITWNGSSTFSWWNDASDGFARSWNEVDVRTVYGVENIIQAEQVGRRWFAEEEDRPEALAE